MKKFLIKSLSIIIAVLVLVPCNVAFASTTKLNATSKSMYTGTSYALKVTGTKGNVTWRSSNSSVAKVSKKGIVTAKKSGSTTIVAKVGKKNLKCKIKVYNAALKYIKGVWKVLEKDQYGRPTYKVRFTNNYAIYYKVDSHGKYHYSGYKKVKYFKTDYGYYIKIGNNNGYRVCFEDNSYKSTLYCMGDGDPYNSDAYYGSSTLYKGSNM